MTEHDLQLKAQIRQLFWGMGFSTRVNVPMRAYVPPSQSRTSEGVEEYTDLDVLAIGMSPDFRVEAVIADCKTSLRRATERMFWLRGLRDFFGADNAYLVRAGDVPAAVRQLAARLEIAVVAPEDLGLLQRGHASALEHLEVLFDSAAISSYHSHMTGLDRRLRPLLEYRQFDYWVYDEHINIQQTVAHLSEVNKSLDPANPVHCALFADYAWLFTLALARAVQHIRRAHVGDIDAALQEYLFGGQLGLREKQRMAAILRRVAGRADTDPELSDVLPPYFPALLELVTRFVQRPGSLMPALRYAEWLTEATAARRTVPGRIAFGDVYNAVAGKLLSDVCGFLVAAADLAVGFRDGARAILENGDSPPRKRPATSSQQEGRGSTAPVSDESESDSDGSPAARSPATRSSAKRTKADRKSLKVRPGQDELLGE